jgi:hypothetical protein
MSIIYLDKLLLQRLDIPKELPAPVAACSAARNLEAGKGAEKPSWLLPNSWRSISRGVRTAKQQAILCRNTKQQDYLGLSLFLYFYIIISYIEKVSTPGRSRRYVRNNDVEEVIIKKNKKYGIRLYAATAPQQSRRYSSASILLSMEEVLAFLNTS